MSKIYEKLLIFTVLTLYYFMSVETANVTVILISFIALFSIDAFKKKYVVFIVLTVLLGLLLIDISYLYFFPLLAYAVYGKYGRMGLLTLIPILLFKEWELLILSLIILYIMNLSVKLYREKELTQRMRDQLTEDNLRLKAQRNEIMKTHEKDIYMAGLNERNRIARDMHDALGHSLSSSILLIESLQYVKDQDKLQQSLKQLQGRLKDGMNDIRHSIHNLYDTSIDLEARIDSYLIEMEQYSKEFIYDVKLTMTHEQKIDMLSIVREALTNIRKHSNATAFKVVIKEHPKFLTLTVKDNGKVSDSYNTGMGLQSMREIVQKYGGVLTTFTADGFVVHTIFYKEAERDEDSHRG